MHTRWLHRRVSPTFLEGDGHRLHSCCARWLSHEYLLELLQQLVHYYTLSWREDSVFRCWVRHRLVNEDHLVDRHFLPVHIGHNLVAVSCSTGHRRDPLSLLHSAEVADARLHTLPYLGSPSDNNEVGRVGQHVEARFELLVAPHHANPQFNNGT